ncbi:MAG: RNA polymerase sigma factor, partial [Nitrospiraceae bacterium]
MGAKPFEDPGTLIQRIAQGDRDAFGHFYDRYAPLVFTFAVRLLGDRFDAEDLLQEVSLQAWSQAGN